MITFGLDTRSFDREMKMFLSKNERDFNLAIADSTNKMHKMAKNKINAYTRNSKVKSGNLVNNINQKITNKGYTGEVISGASYSQAFEDGQRPHTIRVKSKKVLAGPFRGRPAGWKVTKKSKAMGYAVYGKSVQHPGTYPRPFMFPAWRYASKYLEKKIKRALN